MQQLLAPFLTHDFAAPIWRMEIDELTDTLLLEIRNEVEKQVSFASVDLISGQLNFDNYTTEERWLTGIEAAYNGVALLHYYKHENGPEHKGIIAIDAQTSAPLWSNYSFAFDHLSINGPAVYNTQLQPKKLLLTDIKTGQVLRNYSPEDKPLPNSIVIPALAATQHFVPGTLPAQPYGNIIHYHHHNNRIVSLHTFEKSILQQHLFVLNDGGTVYHDVLNSGIQKMQPEAFVLHKNALVYIKNKTELRAISL